jgi:2-dehydro-3-deoxygluconokinase
MPSPSLVCLGEPMVEFNQTKPGEPNWLQGFGGDTSNAAIAAARQGASVGYLTALGEDPFGDMFIELWRRENVDCSRVQRRADGHTGAVFVTHDARGHHFSFMRKGSASSRFADSDLPRDYLAAADMLQLSGISQAISLVARDACFAAIDVMKAAGKRVAYDTNLRLRLWTANEARAVMHEAMKRVDIALPSLDDSIILTGLEEPDAIVDFYLGLGPSIVALKMGRDGALVATAAERRRMAGHSVAAIDATGAGDAFDGAFLTRLLAGDTPFDAARYANAAAALSTTGYGAVAPIPTRSQVESFLAGR